MGLASFTLTLFQIDFLWELLDLQWYVEWTAGLDAGAPPPSRSAIYGVHDFIGTKSILSFKVNWSST